MFGVYHVVGVDNRGNVVSRRAKDILIKFVGPNVGGLAKGRAEPHSLGLQKIFNGLAATFQVASKDDITRKLIIDKLVQTGGAHKPTGYEFGKDDVVEVDFYDKDKK